MAVPSVPILCPGGTVVCLGGGPSLTTEDVEYCRDRADATVAINNGYQIAPWASVLYAADARWWEWHKGAPDFAGLKFTLPPVFHPWPGVVALSNAGQLGLSADPTSLKTGRESGYQAINLAVHLGAQRILLLGYDMQRGPNGEHHWHGNHPRQKPAHFELDVQPYPSMLKPLAQLGVEVINCTRRTALTCFPQMALREAL